MREIDTGNSKRGRGRKRTRDEKLPTGYYDYYLGDGVDRSPNLGIVQYAHVNNLHR